MKSWKTTLGGILTAAGIFLESNDSPVLSLIGQVLSAGGVFLIGLSARDNGVSSEKAGAR